jgi:hypothetical protein
LLPPSQKDEKNAIELKNWTKVNMYSLYQKCKEIAGGVLKFSEFADILEKANKQQIWYYKGLLEVY